MSWCCSSDLRNSVHTIKVLKCAFASDTSDKKFDRPEVTQCSWQDIGIPLLTGFPAEENTWISQDGNSCLFPDSESVWKRGWLLKAEGLFYMCRCTSPSCSPGSTCCRVFQRALRISSQRWRTSGTSPAKTASTSLAERLRLARGSGRITWNDRLRFGKKLGCVDDAMSRTVSQFSLVIWWLMFGTQSKHTNS